MYPQGGTTLEAPEGWSVKETITMHDFQEPFKEPTDPKAGSFRDLDDDDVIRQQRASASCYGGFQVLWG